tara:strand:+ start:586 stop:768 length:183 start_codon:yes stop_codon:yes gene_type:complete
MIRFFVGLMLVIAGTAAIDTPAELIMHGEDSSNWTLFTILTATGLPCMMWGVLGMTRKGF